MVPNDALINVLRRKLNHTFKQQTERVSIYKQRGSTNRVAVKKANQHSPEYAGTVLRQAGMSQEEIDQFLVEAQT